MVSRAKKGMVMPFILQLILFLLLLAIIWYIIFRFSSPATSFVNECTAVSGDALWVPLPCNSDVAYENQLVERKEYGGQTYACCGPIPGRKTAFQNEYQDQVNNGLNIIDRQVDSDIVIPSGPVTQDAPINSEVQFFMNAQEITQTVSFTYSPELPPNAVVEKNSSKLFRAEHTFTSGAYCTLKLRPTYVDGSGRLRFSTDTSMGEQYIHEVSSESCDSPLQLPIKPIRTLEGTNYAEPGLYKLEFVQWDAVQNGNVVQFANSLILVSDDPAESVNSDPTHDDAIEVKPVVKRSEFNTNTCIFAPYMISDDSFPSLAKSARSSTATPPTSYPDTFDSQSGFFILREAQFPQYEPYVHISLEDSSGANATRTFSVDECDYIDVFSAAAYEGNYQGSKTPCGEFNRYECRDPNERSQIIDQEIQHCFWNKATTFGEWFDNQGGLFSGVCQGCGAISSCNQYDDEDSCNLNQCLGRDNMDQRCFWEDNDCNQCNYNNPCSQYDSEETCTQDYCSFQERTGSSCSWSSGVCISS